MLHLRHALLVLTHRRSARVQFRRRIVIRHRPSPVSECFNARECCTLLEYPRFDTTDSPHRSQPKCMSAKQRALKTQTRAIGAHVLEKSNNDVWLRRAGIKLGEENCDILLSMSAL